MNASELNEFLVNMPTDSVLSVNGWTGDDTDVLGKSRLVVTNMWKLQEMAEIARSHFFQFIKFIFSYKKV